MVIQSDVKRLWWRIFFVGIFVDVLIAWAIVWVFANAADDKLLAIFFVWLGLQALSLFVILRGLIHVFTAFVLGQSKATERGFLAVLEGSKLPRPNEYEYSVSSYLERVAEDEKQEAAIRVTAGMILGGKLLMAESLGFVRTSFIDAAHSKGLERYRENSPSD